MENYTGAFLIIGILVFVLLIGAVKNKAEWMLNFVLRGIAGMMAVYFLNLFLADVVPGMKIGYNPITFLTSGILGLPGIAMLYGINFYMLL
ncbi:MAG: pro-sigmaK processing inhibitor BofA family protein [Lachnospiraceae bacterium]|nr:pro-sigmaK processing inhibitor BofA family protein [Lachnospiraceae bacterium]